MFKILIFAFTPVTVTPSLPPVNNTAAAGATNTNNQVNSVKQPSNAAGFKR